ncbi:MAG TPA: LytTR family DNA-binding domain-containing protein [Casimicrobiaceae bacterium]|nr:LytTR family DNA-binding domain-containing protein [Casimicrobiaceae bacterium]HWD36977.1 LytTR family DNA-binding domain-containing protein [Casimicrobiaceae bacterium]
MNATAAPTAVIADDERLMREQIAAQLRQAWPELLVVGEAVNGREAVALVQSLAPDVVFLDIRMPEMDGIAAAKAIGDRAHVVFVTAYDQYAIDAFEQGAVDYLLKPAEPERVALTCERLRERLDRKPRPMDALLAELSERLQTGGSATRSYLRWVQASVGGVIRMIPTSEILFFRAEDKYTRVQTARYEALIRKPIKELVLELDPAEFWQIHRATLVRVDAVEQVSRNLRGNQVVHLRGTAEKLEVSRSFNHLFKQM